MLLTTGIANAWLAYVHSKNYLRYEYINEIKTCNLNIFRKYEKLARKIDTYKENRVEVK